MKRVLIICPYFPPVNGADMQRVRMALPYFQDLNWQAEIVAVDEKYVDLPVDPLLTETVPKNIIVHKVKALPKKYTQKFGLGAIALRAMPYYKTLVNKILKNKPFDLIFFSTTQFPLMILGAYWKKKFKIPYLLDFQDPWHSDYYKDKPKSMRPKKYWFSYRLNKYLEPIAVKAADGIISVSETYITLLKQRYPNLQSIPCEVITFGAFAPDLQIAKTNAKQLNTIIQSESGKINIVYIGRGGYDMIPALEILFGALKLGLDRHTPNFSSLKFTFIGTSYAPNGTGIKTVSPIAEKIGVGELVHEITDRIPFYETLLNLLAANGLLIPGSDDEGYTASKLYPYILTEKPMLSIFPTNSDPANFVTSCNAGTLIPIESSIEEAFKILQSFLLIAKSGIKQSANKKEFEPYTAPFLAKRIITIFDKIAR